ncbi:MAG: stage II sporulation protein P [Zhaonellaceae bacterium]|nr:stage II sporulation protein P [Clostridia bacterium]
MRSVFVRISPGFKKKFQKVILFVLLLGIAWQFGGRLAQMSKDKEKSPKYFSGETLKIVHSLTDIERIVLNTLPILAIGDYTETFAGLEYDEFDLDHNILSDVTQTDFNNPKSLLESQLSLFRMISSTGFDEKIYEDRDEEIIPDLESDAFEEEWTPPISPEFIASDKPLVAIYTTHNAETYEPTDGKPKLEGKNAGITKVATKLSETLESKGIGVIRSTTIHDYPSFPRSYGNSEKTVKAMLAENPSVQIVIDVHRDAGVNKKEVVRINNKDAAKILLVVGTNTRLEHPHWKKNKAFAETVVKKMDELYPGLSKGIRMQDGRYNQHVHPNAILIEVGNAEKTTQEEAEYAVTLFADVIHHVLADMQKTRI